MTTALNEHFQRLYNQHGKLTSQLVIDDARPAGSPLHDNFEWDDSVAGEKYRLSQASDLIRTVKITYRDDQPYKKVRAFHSVNRVDGPTYVPIEEIRDDEFSKHLILQQARREWAAFQRKYSDLEEFLDIISETIAS